MSNNNSNRYESTAGAAFFGSRDGEGAGISFVMSSSSSSSSISNDNEEVVVVVEDAPFEPMIRGGRGMGCGEGTGRDVLGEVGEIDASSFGAEEAGRGRWVFLFVFVFAGGEADGDGKRAFRAALEGEACGSEEVLVIPTRRACPPRERCC